MCEDIFYIIMTIEINEKEYKIKQTIRSLFLWEQITGRTFEIKSTLDNYLYFYCILLANNENFISWDEFINIIDENPQIIIELSKKLTQSQEIENLLNTDSEDNEKDKKKRITIAELYSILVLQFGLNPDYVLDEIQTYEISSLMKYSFYKNRDDWEQSRLISFIIAQSNSKKKLKLQDIIKFEWEKEEKENTTITKEEIENLSKQAEEFERYFKSINDKC